MYSPQCTPPPPFRRGRLKNAPYRGAGRGGGDETKYLPPLRFHDIPMETLPTAGDALNTTPPPPRPLPYRCKKIISLSFSQRESYKKWTRQHIHTQKNRHSPAHTHTSSCRLSNKYIKISLYIDRYRCI